MGRLGRVGLAVGRRLPVGAGLRVGTLEGRVGHRLGRRGPTTAAVRAAFGLTDAEARRVATAQSGNSTRTRNLRALAMTSPAKLPSLVEGVGLEHLRARAGRGVVAVVAPWGPLLGAFVVLSGLGRDAVFIADIAPAQSRRWGMRVLSPGQDGSRAALVLKTAVEHLRADGLVGLTIAGHSDQAMADVPFFGGMLAVPRGIATMARRGRAPVVPMTTAWAQGGRLRVTAHLPLELDQPADDPDAADADLLRRLAATFESAARAAPSEGDRRLTAAIGQARLAGRARSAAP